MQLYLSVENLQLFVVKLQLFAPHPDFLFFFNSRLCEPHCCTTDERPKHLIKWILSEGQHSVVERLSDYIDWTRKYQAAMLSPVYTRRPQGHLVMSNWEKVVNAC